MVRRAYGSADSRNHLVAWYFRSIAASYSRSIRLLMRRVRTLFGNASHRAGGPLFAKAILPEFLNCYQRF